MTNEEIGQARKNYNNILLEQEKLKQLKNRMLELEKEPVVQEYCKLLNNIKEISELDTNGMIKNSFEEIASNTYNSNRILVYMGASKQVNESMAKYCDLETGHACYIPFSEQFEFEKKNIIVRFKTEKESVSSDIYEKKFEMLRNKFFEKLLTQPQDEVLRQIFKYSNKQKVKLK